MSSKILLVGMMGAGKTTVGQALATRLGWHHLDSDAQVEANTGRTVPEIFAVDGEDAFRREEARALADAVSEAVPTVVSVAGGAVLDAANRELLKRAGPVVWLRADPSTLAGRVGSGAGRPLLEGDPAASLRNLYEARRPLYESLADLTVDVDQLEPAAVVERIAGWISARGER